MKIDVYTKHNTIPKMEDKEKEKEKDELLWKIHQHRDKFPHSTIANTHTYIDTPLDELRVIALKCEIEELKFESVHNRQLLVRAFLLGTVLFIDKHGLDTIDESIAKLKRDVMTHLKI